MGLMLNWCQFWPLFEMKQIFFRSTPETLYYLPAAFFCSVMMADAGSLYWCCIVASTAKSSSLVGPICCRSPGSPPGPAQGVVLFSPSVLSSFDFAVESFHCAGKSVFRSASISCGVIPFGQEALGMFKHHVTLPFLKFNRFKIK